MKYVRALASAGFACALGAASNAAISFTFHDPAGQRELTYTSAGAGSNVSYSTAIPVALIVDGSDEGMGVLTYNTSLTMNITVGTAGPLAGVPGGTFASMSGEFIFRDFATTDELLRGTFTSGGMVGLSSAGALLTSNANGLSYTASGALLNALTLAGVGQLFGDFDASFTITDASPGITIGGDSYFASFTANTAFTGTATVPAPGAFALVAGAGLCVLRRRR